MACRMCFNAYTDPDLSCFNDLSYIPVGSCVDGYRILFRSGAAKVTALVFEQRCDDGWHSLCSYVPKFCPNCGRRLMENEIKDISL